MKKGEVYLNRSARRASLKNGSRGMRERFTASFAMRNVHRLEEEKPREKGEKSEGDLPPSRKKPKPKRGTRGDPRHQTKEE